MHNVGTQNFASLRINMKALTETSGLFLFWALEDLANPLSRATLAD